MSETIIGVDIGGTSIKIGWLSTSGNILVKWEIPTNTTNNGATILSDIWTSISDKIIDLDINTDEVIGIGVGVPGFINTTSGIVYEAVNIGWKNVDIQRQLHALSGLSICVSNDANTAVLGENWRGAGNQDKNVLAVTLGTGVGGGVITNGELVNGENGTAAEIGHLTVDVNGFGCNCGRKGCLETIASATGIVRQAKSTIKKHPTSDLAAFYTSNSGITAKDVFERSKDGDVLCEQIIDYTIDVLGLALANIATVLNPSKILIGGGVSKAGNILIDGIQSAFQKYALQRTSSTCEIKSAQLGNDAGIIGAAFLIKQQLRQVTF